MDRDTPVAELKELVRRFCEERDWDQYHSAKELAIGAVTESAELLDLFRFLSEAQVEAMLADADGRGKVEAELADVLYFVLRFAQKFEIDLDEALRRKLVVNAERYPVAKARGRNVKAEEL